MSINSCGAGGWSRIADAHFAIACAHLAVYFENRSKLFKVES